MQKGQKMSQEQKDKISKSHKGKKKPWSGKWMTEEDKLAISNRMKGNKLCLGRKLKPETIEKIRQSNLGKKHNISEEGMARMKTKEYDVWNKGKDTKKSHVCSNCGEEFKSHLDSKFCSVECSVPHRSKEKHYRWIEDRTKVIGRHDRSFHDSDMKQWRIAVYERDSYSCSVPDEDCSGRIEAHHILRWKDHQDLRYEVSNGITLCHLHHPKTRKSEDQNVLLFQDIVRRKTSD